MRTVKAIFFLVVAMMCFSRASYAGSISGNVLFDGSAPVPDKVEVKSDVPVCGLHKESAKIIVGPGREVKDAVVRIVGLKNTHPADGHLDQVGCEFAPHVQVVTTGSKLVITSSDSVLHNAHGFYEDGKTAFNIAVPIVGMEVDKQLKNSGVIRMRCDAGHTWMKGYLYVTEDMAVVTSDDGKFSFPDVPAGTYELEVWQEWAGIVKTTVKVAEGAGEPVSVTLKAPAA
jgi:hypothetical protein